MSRPKVIFVIHRFGSDIGGGAERYCFQIAQEMSRDWDIEVVTTCAKNYLTWENEFSPGLEWIGPVAVKRFPVDFTRDMEAFVSLSERISPASNMTEMEAWMTAQGPYSGALFSYLRDQSAKADLTIFFSYLYATTYYGISSFAGPCTLVPMAHDEPPLHLPLYEAVFEKARNVVYLSIEERRLVDRRFGQRATSGKVIGLGIEDTWGNPEALPSGLPEDSPFGIYIGRVEPSKGLYELFHYLKMAGPPIDLVLIGECTMQLPKEPWIHQLGYLAEAQKLGALRRAHLLFQPSPYESLSLSCLEAWVEGIPVLANGDSAVLEGQCRRSGGGLIYKNQSQFIEALNGLVETPARRLRMGLNGRNYTLSEYRWDRVITGYQEVLEQVRG